MNFSIYGVFTQLCKSSGISDVEAVQIYSSSREYLNTLLALSAVELIDVIQADIDMYIVTGSGNLHRH